MRKYKKADRLTRAIAGALIIGYVTTIMLVAAFATTCVVSLVLKIGIL